MESWVPVKLVSKWIVVLLIVFIKTKVECTGYYGYPMMAISKKICANECKKWVTKLCWDGYKKRRVPKMVCEKYEQTCCPGYEGPNCNDACIDCDKIHGFERRFVEIYSKIKTLEDTCSNTTVVPVKPDGGNNKECTCPPGPSGQKGDPGPRGPQGVPGFPGEQGPKGEPGRHGGKGTPGLPGSDGLDGLPGPVGPPGLIGLPGVAGDSGPPGKSGLPGLPGLQGQKGELGPYGVRGPKGESGSKGDPGRPGRDAIAGGQGSKGDPGDPGSPGLPGNPGQPGRDGFPGPRGPKGMDGRDGIRGAKGEIGVRGYPGEAGRDGVDGLRGPVGPEGPQGEQGPRGGDGRPGPKGLPGRPGDHGRKGETGSAGLPGVPGLPGDVTKVEESQIIRELLTTVRHLETRLESTTKEIKELQIICNRISSCQFNCTADSYRCKCGQCIPKKYQCDGFPQCSDGSDEDEALCGVFCTAVEFKCNTSGRCIPGIKKCDGVPDCPDDSDEAKCESHGCTEGDFPCRDGSKCLAREERCDGKDDCQDGSDEIDCGCQASEFRCGSGECIRRDRTCDNFPDCVDESDESRSLCSSSSGITCSEGQIACRNQQGCVSLSSVCDGIKHCFDNSDEENCSLPIKTRPTTPTTITTSTSTTTPATKTTTTTTTSTTAAPSTTTFTAPPTTTEDEDAISGSGDLTDCEGLYQLWNDTDFPGGKPPPLGPNEKVNRELCEFLRRQGLPMMNMPRRKRHKNIPIDDEDDAGEDISFVEFSDPPENQPLRIEPKAEAVRSRQDLTSVATCPHTNIPILWLTVVLFYIFSSI